MATKKKREKPEKKMYTYEEYRQAFCAAEEEEDEREFVTPSAFGVQLARDALARIDRGPRQPKT